MNSDPCPRCAALERDNASLADALRVTERALEAERALVEKLRAQRRRVTLADPESIPITGRDYTIRTLAERTGRKYQTVQVWMIRSADTADPFPTAIPDTYPKRYDYATVEGWLARHPRLLNRKME